MQGTVSNSSNLRRLAAQQAASPDTFREVMLAFGHLVDLGPADLEALHALRMAVVASPRRDPFMDGYLMAMADLLSSCSRTLAEHAEQAEAMDTALPRVPRLILTALGDGPRRPADLAKDLAIDPAQVTRVLDGLDKKGLVEVARAKDARSRPRELTALGHLVLARLSERDSERDAVTSAITEQTLAMICRQEQHEVLDVTEIAMFARAGLPPSVSAAAFADAWVAAACKLGFAEESAGQCRWIGEESAAQAAEELSSFIEGPSSLLAQIREESPGAPPPGSVVWCTTARRLPFVEPTLRQNQILAVSVGTMESTPAEVVIYDEAVPRALRAGAKRGFEVVRNAGRIGLRALPNNGARHAN